MLGKLTYLILLLWCIAVIADSVSGSGSGGASCFAPCSSDSDCGSTCGTCTGNICVCATGPNGVCQIRANHQECYNPANSTCCFSYWAGKDGGGAICPSNKKCCAGESNTVCVDETKEKCCSVGLSVYASKCPIDKECCGSNNASCYNADTEQCCCPSSYPSSPSSSLPFSCPLTHTCDCSNSVCVPPFTPSPTPPPPTSPLLCNGNGTCNRNARTCTCKAGYFPASNCYDTLSCSNYDPCTGDPSICPSELKCVNTSTSTYSCNVRKYYIVSVQTGLVLTGGAKGATVVMDNKATTDFSHQLWTFMPSQGGYIENVQSGYVLDVNGGDVYADGELITWSKKPPSATDNDDYNQNQMWIYDSTTFALTSRKANFAADVEHGSTSVGAQVIVYWPNFQPNQQWSFEEFVH